MTAPIWTYPALLASIGAGRSPDRAALRFLVRRMREEAFPEISEPDRRRRQVRRAVIALLEP
ncbi:hypothetical protein [Sphingobium estronivorans]|uniref:hypothetical protein n=1 Tax=Sphingobium estronivorans TaxID=1577690 RepID=UPI00123AC4F4|nr:hypothetical protein [Sphingobium estronivorans]